MSTVSPLEEAPVEKEKRRSFPRWIFEYEYVLVFIVANFAIGVGSIAVPTALIPAQITALHLPAIVDAWVIAAGGGASLIAMPLIGYLSDRFGRRRWVWIGSLLLITGFFLLAHTTLPFLFLGSIVGQFGIAGCLAALIALLPERFPSRHRGSVAAAAAMAPLVGNVFGQIVVGIPGQTFMQVYQILGICSFVGLAFFAVVDVLRSFLNDGNDTALIEVDPLKTHQFAPVLRSPEFLNVWISRCLMFLALDTTSNFMIFYLMKIFHTANVQSYFLIFTAALVVGSISSGIWSDRIQRRKIFAVSACALAALGLGVLVVNVFLAVWSLILMAAGIFGLGCGVYLGCDLTIVTFMAHHNERGSDLGIMNTSIYFPLLLSPLLASVVLSLSQSYVALFLTLVVSSMLAAVFLIRVKNIR